eukprot:TRINITY_DN496_c0_g1_i11.p1 TRINITY_DN496_c0_g1~~TRINITY_DN496_c0_g1_i11.p1  ORF type:complete len:265 (+),score=132.10 TRINITY_DN496_c0_g1_i11:57-851(+)
MPESVIQLHDLDYHYVTRGKKSEERALKNVTLDFPKGARVLVVGQNGAGKSTLLKIMAGRTMVPKGKCVVLGRDAFHDTTLIKDISYLGEWWSQSRNFLDVTVQQIVDTNCDPARLEELCKVLRVELTWKLGHLSDGQLRRSQILFGLALARDVIILDEITTDVDLLVRDALLEFLRRESDRGCTILYATHIFEGIDDWPPTHVLRLEEGNATLLSVADDIPEAKEPNFLYFNLVRNWLREERRLKETTGKTHWALKAEGLKVT